MQLLLLYILVSDLPKMANYAYFPVAILESQTANQTFVTATLPVLKMLTERALSTSTQQVPEVIEAFISACLQRVEHQ